MVDKTGQQNSKITATPLPRSPYTLPCPYMLFCQVVLEFCILSTRKNTSEEGGRSGQENLFVSDVFMN